MASQQFKVRDLGEIQDSLKIDFETLDSKIEGINLSISDHTKRIGDLDILKCNESKFDKELAEMRDSNAASKKVADNCLISS